MIFLDTCLLIDYSKERINIDLSKDYCINSIIRLEFKVGALNKRELKKINRILSKINLVDTDQSILDLADLLVEKYTLFHGMKIYDAIIAATCLIYDLPLWTYNKKDFHFINGLVLKEENIATR